ncbi:unnamed protein product [Nippostrongylus brasiliensis]|uniref:Conjugal transfer protein TraN n=1 Tax=Nippostrongylus brasiliensis TaxID=27835 RepID=A0A0N4XRG5_NIPBR|nr:unnamed protein product [Nippostrongylus brasiliensis]
MRWWRLWVSCLLLLEGQVDAQVVNQNIGSQTGQNVGSPGTLFSGTGNNPYYGGGNSQKLN